VSFPISRLTALSSMETPKKFEKTRLSLLNEGCKVNVVADKAAGIAKTVARTRENNMVAGRWRGAR